MKMYLLKICLVLPILYYSISSCPRKGNYFIDFTNNEIEIGDILDYKIKSVKISRISKGDTFFDSENRYSEKGEHYYHSFMLYNRYFKERYYYGDSVRVFEECEDGECSKDERVTLLENDYFLLEKLDSNQQVVSWAKRKNWNVKDTLSNTIKYFLFSEFSNVDGESGLIERLGSIDYYDEQKRVIQTDLYFDDTSFYSYFSIYKDNKLIKDSSENYQHNYYYKNDILTESKEFSSELLTKMNKYSNSGKIKEVTFYNDTLSIVANNVSYFNQNGLDSFMLSYFMVDHYFESHTDSTDFWMVDNEGDSIFGSSISEHDSLKIDLIPDTLIYEYEYY